MPRKIGSRRFNAAVSREKNEDKLDDFIREVNQGIVKEGKEIAFIEKPLSNSRWNIKFYTKTIDNQVREHTYQATKAGNLLKSAAPIMSGSVVLAENVSVGENPQFVITAVFTKDSVKEFRKVYEYAYSRTLEKLKNKEECDSKGNAYRLFWVDQRIFNQQLAGKVQEEENSGIIFANSDDEDSTEEAKAADKPLTKPKGKAPQREFKTIEKPDGYADNSDVDVDNI